MNRGNYVAREKGHTISDEQAIRAYHIAEKVVRKVLTESGTHYVLTPPEYDDAVIFLTKKMIGVR